MGAVDHTLTCGVVSFVLTNDLSGGADPAVAPGDGVLDGDGVAADALGGSGKMLDLATPAPATAPNTARPAP